MYLERAKFFVKVEGVEEEVVEGLVCIRDEGGDFVLDGVDVVVLHPAMWTIIAEEQVPSVAC